MIGLGINLFRKIASLASDAYNVRDRFNVLIKDRAGSTISLRQ